MRTLLATAALIVATPAVAADHIDAPATQSDAAADISDFYAWYDTGSDRLVTAIAFAALAAPGTEALWDADVAYVIHLDRDGDNTSDHDVTVRFGQDSLGAWGVQVSNLPGAGAPQIGPVESVIETPGGRVFTGLREDAFTFDFDGLVATIDNCTNNTQPAADLAFDGTNDTFAGTNVTAVVIEMDGPSALGAGNTALNTWVTTHRF